MVWSSNCSTVARIAHAVLILRWATSYWAVSPYMRLSVRVARCENVGRDAEGQLVWLLPPVQMLAFDPLRTFRGFSAAPGPGAEPTGARRVNPGCSPRACSVVPARRRRWAP